MPQRIVSLLIVVGVTLDLLFPGRMVPTCYWFPCLAVWPMLLIWYAEKMAGVTSLSASRRPRRKPPPWVIRVVGWIALCLLVLGFEAGRLLRGPLASKLYE